MKKFYLASIVMFLFLSLSCDNWETIPQKVIVTDNVLVKNDSSEIINEVRIPSETNVVYLGKISNNFIIAGTKKGDIFTSVDRGNNWILSYSIGYSVNCIQEYPKGIVVGADKGLYLLDSKGSYVKTLIEPVDRFRNLYKHQRCKHKK